MSHPEYWLLVRWARLRARGPNWRPVLSESGWASHHRFGGSVRTKCIRLWKRHREELVAAYLLGGMDAAAGIAERVYERGNP